MEKAVAGPMEAVLGHSAEGGIGPSGAVARPLLSYRAAGSAQMSVPAMVVPLFIFLHVPKTAGTSYRWVLMKQFGKYYYLLGNEIYRHRQDAELAPWSKPGFFDDKLVIAGHIERDHQVINAIRGRRIIFLSLMRDPVKRVISLYNYLRKRKVHPLNEWLSTRSLLEAFTQPGKFQDSCINYQLKAIFGRDSGSDVESILNANNYIIGKSENLPAMANAVSAISGMVPGGNIPVFNTKEENLQAMQDNGAPIEAHQQADFMEAIAVIESANRDEYKLFDRIGDSVVASISLKPAHARIYR